MNNKINRHPNFIPKATPDQIIICQCGCNQQIPYIKLYSYKGWPKYINRHQNNLRKGKTNEEIFGMKKAKDMNYRPESFKQKIKERQQGLSLDQRFGKEKASEIKNKIKESAKRSWEEKYGLEEANRLKELARNRISKLNDMNKWSKDEVIERILEVYKEKKLLRRDFWENYQSYNIPSINVIKRIFGNLDNLSKELNIEFEERDRSEYLKNNPEVLKNILKNSPVVKKGLNYEDRYGDRADEIRKKVSMSKIEGHLNGTIVNWNKGKIGLQVAWNKGLTKDDHPGMMAVSSARKEFMQENPCIPISSQEIKVQEFLINQKIDFIPQYYVDNIDEKYVSDIYIPDKNIIIEIDGIYWHSLLGRKELDKKRTEQMMAKGYKVIRFTDKEVDKQFEYVTYSIKKILGIEDGN